MADVFTAPANLLIGNDPTEQHPLLAYQIRNNVWLHRARLYVVNSEPIKLRRQASEFRADCEGRSRDKLRHSLRATMRRQTRSSAMLRTKTHGMHFAPNSAEKRTLSLFLVRK